MAIRLLDISAATGMSIPSVSQILNGRGNYSATTRTLVLETAARLGYRPNAAARAMVERRFRTYGLLMSADPGLGQLRGGCLDGIDAAMAERSLSLLFARLSDQQIAVAAEQTLPLLTHWSVDGVIISYVWRVPPALGQMLERHRLPAVYLNIRLAHNSVHPDDRAGFEEITTKVLALGHRRIAYFSGCGGPHQQDGHYSAVDRRAGYCAAMNSAQLQPRLHCALLGPGEYGAFIRPWLLAPDRPTAVLCYSPHEAGTLIHVLYQAGLAPGRDLAIVVVNDNPTRIGDLAIDTLVIPGHRLGTEAVAMLEARIAANGANQTNRAIPLTWHPGQSLVPADQIQPPG